MNIEKKTIKALLKKLDEFPRNDRKTLFEFLEHNEWGVALDISVRLLLKK